MSAWRHSFISLTDVAQPARQAEPTPEQELEGFYCPSHPDASPLTGWVAPKKNRFPEGTSGNPQGNGKSFSIRNAARRRLSTNKVDGVGEETWRNANELIDAVERGDTERIDAIIKLIHEVEGRPQEHIAHTGSEGLVAININPGALTPPPLPGTESP